MIPSIIMETLRWDGIQARNVPDELAQEEPLEIRVRGRAVSVTMRTPGEDAELAAGFLFTEGIIRSQQDVLSVTQCGRNESGNVLNVMLAPEVAVDFSRLTRHVFASSSCGLCGKTTIEAIHHQFPPVKSNIVVDCGVLALLPEQMKAAQPTFARTGGLHAAALFNARGQLIVLREDIGRHNAVDKVVGYCLFNGVFPQPDSILLVSGRTSFEIMQKALAARIPIVASVSAASTLAAQFAEASGQTLVGFLREARLNVYTHVHRIAFPASAMK